MVVVGGWGGSEVTVEDVLVCPDQDVIAEEEVVAVVVPATLVETVVVVPVCGVVVFSAGVVFVVALAVVGGGVVVVVVVVVGPCVVGIQHWETSTEPWSEVEPCKGQGVQDALPSTGLYVALGQSSQMP